MRVWLALATQASVEFSTRLWVGAILAQQRTRYSAHVEDKPCFSELGCGVSRATGVTTRNLEKALENFVGLHVPQLVTCRHCEGTVACSIRRGKERSPGVLLALDTLQILPIPSVNSYRSVIYCYEDISLHLGRRAQHHKFTEVWWLQSAAGRARDM